jgi:hypothetical protein
MRKIKYLLILIILLIPLLSLSASQVNVIGYTPMGFEQLSPSTTVPVGFSAPYLTTAGAVFVTVESYNIRYRIDGVAPTSSVGHLIVADNYQNLWFNDTASIRNFKAIGIGGTALLNVSYYRKN